MSRSLRILMICYYYPPLRTSGTQRNLGFATELKKLGHQPVVLTVSNATDPFVFIGDDDSSPALETHRAIEIPFTKILHPLDQVVYVVARSLNHIPKNAYFKETFCMPDPQIGWFFLPKALRLARDCDAIYVSASPFSAAIFSTLASRWRAKPLILDFRDAWTLNPYGSPLRPQRWLAEKLEKRILHACSALILNTPGALRLYAEKYPELASRMHCIPNGFDALNKAEQKRHDPFTIMHVGTFSPDRRPDLLLSALHKLGNDNIEFVQVGGSHESLDRYPGLRTRVVENVSHEEALAMMQSADLLYLKQGYRPDVRNYIAIGAKTYEYLSTGLPILADCPEGDNAEIVRAYASNSYVVTSGESDVIMRCVANAYEKRDHRRIQIDKTFAERFHRRALTEQLVKVIEGASTT